MGGTCCAGRKDGQVSSANIPLPGFIINAYLKGIDLAEDTVGKPGNLAEI
jgi:hypothetical protein